MVSAERTSVADCCGATLLHNFYNDGETDSGLKSFRSGHLYFAILNEGQSNRWCDTLKKKGFRVVSNTVRNSNTGNLLHLWVRDRVKPVKKLKKGMFK